MPDGKFPDATTYKLRYNNLMKSILIKDTTRQEREQIIRESLGDDYDVGCGYESAGINYQLYIDGIKELRDLNMEADCGFEVAHPEEQKSGCNFN